MAAKMPSILLSAFCFLLSAQTIGPKPESTLKQDRTWAGFEVGQLLYNRLMRAAHIFFVFLRCSKFPTRMALVLVATCKL